MQVITTEMEGRRRRIWVSERSLVGERTLAPARYRGKWFHVTADNKPAYKPRFDDVGPFVNVGGGLFLAAVRLGQVGFHIRPDGKPAYRKRFRWVRDFGLVGSWFLAEARVISNAQNQTPDLLLVYISRFGNIVK